MEENVVEVEMVKDEVDASTPQDIAPYLEALLFASGHPLSAERFSEVLPFTQQKVQDALSYLEGKYSSEEFGVELVKVAGRYQFRTKAHFAAYVRELKSEKPKRLTMAALETLAIIAYRQPIVKSDIEKLRGVDATPTLKTLLERGLIKIVGHQATVGQPALYGSTEEFLEIFGLKDLSQLPTLRDLKEFDADPGETETEEAPAAAAEEASPPVS